MLTSFIWLIPPRNPPARILCRSSSTRQLHIAHYLSKRNSQTTHLTHHKSLPRSNERLIGLPTHFVSSTLCLKPNRNCEHIRLFGSTSSTMAPADGGGESHKKHKVSIIGSGNWGSAIAKILAENTAANSSVFERDVHMYVYEEEYTIPKSSKHYDPGSELAIKPQKLTTLINRLHENVKYLAGIPLPENVIANPDIVDTVRDSTILVFNLPHQFLRKACESLKGNVVPYARGISCIKGVDASETHIRLFSETISSTLGIYCGALSGANIANEVALEKFSETTIAYAPPAMDPRQDSPSSQSPAGDEQKADGDSKATGPKLQPMPMEYPPLTQALIRSLFHRPYFHVRLVRDEAGVSLGGALKNIVALAAGFVDGLGWGDNAKAAIMRVGILEQVKFGQMFFPDTFNPQTMTEESCGVADMITSCASGRNFRSARMAVQRAVSVYEIERTEMNGQKLQGTSTSEEVWAFLKARGCQAEFPLFCAVYDILKGNVKAEQLPDLIEKKEEDEIKSA